MPCSSYSALCGVNPHLKEKKVQTKVLIALQSHITQPHLHSQIDFLKASYVLVSYVFTKSINYYIGKVNGATNHEVSVVLLRNN